MLCGTKYRLKQFTSILFGKFIAKNIFLFNKEVSWQILFPSDTKASYWLSSFPLITVLMAYSS